MKLSSIYGFSFSHRPLCHDCGKGSVPIALWGRTRRPWLGFAQPLHLGLATLPLEPPVPRPSSRLNRVNTTVPGTPQTRQSCAVDTRYMHMARDGRSGGDTRRAVNELVCWARVAVRESARLTRIIVQYTVSE